MNVLFTSKHCCIRVYKQAVALMKRGIGIHFLHNRIANGDCVRNALPSQNFYHDQEQYRLKLQMFRGIDIIHCHNEPDWLVWVAKEVHPNIPVVYDCHDLTSMRGLDPFDDELKAMEVADAYIFPSKSYYDKVPDIHHIPKEKPRAVVFSACLEEMVVKKPMPYIGGIVYEGGVVGEPPNWNNIPLKLKEVFPSYRDYRKLAEVLYDSGIPFSMFGVVDEIRDEYVNLGALCFPNQAHPQLLSNLSRFDWGFVGSVEPHPNIESCMPNKLFEYIAAGIPVIVCNATEAAEFVQKHGLGVVVDSIQEIPGIYDRHNKFQKDILAKRHIFTMESEVLKVMDVYRLLLQ